MRNEPDLYPPDVEVVTPDRRHARDRALAGTFLLTLGTGLLLEQALDNDLDVFWLAVGFALLAGWAQAPRFVLFAWGAVVSGFALGGFLDSLDFLPFERAISLLCGAAGFFAVYVRYPHKARWALIPAGVVAAFAFVAAGVALIGLIPAVLTSLGLPVLLILGGTLLVFRHAFPPKVVKAGLVVIAVLFVSSAASTVGEWDGPDVDFTPFATEQQSVSLPDLAGRTLVLDAMDADVDLRMDDESAPMVTARYRHMPGHVELAVDDGGDDVEVVLRRHGPPFGRRSVDSWQVVVPSGTDVRVRGGDGLVKADVDGGEVDITTEDGRVLAILEGRRGDVRIVSEDGDVQVHANQRAVDFHATTEEGEIVVDGQRVGSPFSREGSGTTVDVTTEEGDILLVGAPS